MGKKFGCCKKKSSSTRCDSSSSSDTSCSSYSSSYSSTYGYCCNKYPNVIAVLINVLQFIIQIIV